MGINLKGFATGFAKTLATRLEDETEKEEKILANRFNLAASNRLTRQKEADELRKVYESRVKNFSSAYPMATEEQIVAAISTETNYNTLMKAHEEGFSVEEKANVLDNYVTVGKMPETFTTAMGLVQQTVQPQVGAVDTSDRQTKSVLGINVSPGERTRQKYAEQYGVDAKELDAYAEGAVTIPDLGAMGSVSAEFLKSPDTLPQKIDKLRIRLFEAKKSQDPDEIKQAEDLVAAAVASQTFSGEYDPDKEVKKMEGRAMQLNAQSSKSPMEVEELKSLEKQITYAKNLGKKETRSESATATVTLAGLLRRTVTNVTSDLMPAGTLTRVGDEVLPTNLVKSEAFVSAKKKGFEQALAILASKGMVNAQGVFRDNVAREAWLGAGGQISEDGRALVPSLASVLAGPQDTPQTTAPGGTGKRTGAAAPSTTIPEARNQQEFDALFAKAAVGSKVKGPDGKVYIKQ